SPHTPPPLISPSLPIIPSSSSSSSFHQTFSSSPTLSTSSSSHLSSSLSSVCKKIKRGLPPSGHPNSPDAQWGYISEDTVSLTAARRSRSVSNNSNSNGSTTTTTTHPSGEANGSTKILN